METVDPLRCRRLRIALVLCATCVFTANAQTISAQRPSEASTPASAYVLDPDTVDFLVPIVTMEQIHSLTTRIQGYRIQIFRDGRGVYHGLKNVKTLGEVRFSLRPEQVKRIETDFAKYKFWQVPENQYGIPKGMGVLASEFTVREGGKVKTIGFGGPALGLMLQSVIEAEVNSAVWRCPYMDVDLDIELCKSRDQYIRLNVRAFLEQELPKLLETYK